MAIANFPSAWMNDEHRALEDAVRRFITERWVPRAAEWRKAGRLGPEVWREAGAQGLLCAAMPEAYGGGGGDFGHDAVIILEAARANLSGFGGGLHSGIVAPYLLHYGSEEQKRRWLPKMATRRIHHRHRHDRAGHRLRPAGHPHDRAARRRRTTC